ncbi:phiSA1p31-related protein [Streptomyces longwoodensis]|uniref:phiSA1p31-related protein n=1 Tax=Streptomyces longwoodensis TaxID=68231 RepID=UPI003408AE55
MTETFEVGQKVTIHGDVRAEVTYGPFRSTYGTYTGYVVRIGETERLQRAGDLSAIPEPPRFSIGDKVRAGLTEKYAGTIIAGPFISRHGDGPFFIVEDEDGKHGFPTESVMTKVEDPEPVKAGDRVRVVKDSDGHRSGQFVGRVGVLERISEYETELPNLVRFGDGKGLHGADNGRWWCAQVERVEDEDTYTHDGVVYDLSARYRDTDGDYWTFKLVDGTVRGHCAGSDRDTSAYIGEYSDTLDEAVSSYGPLVRV